jgi:IS5 family transposase
MQGKPSETGQRHFLCQGLSEFLNPKEGLYQLAHAIPWDDLDEEFSQYYVDFGRPSKPTRLMISLLLLKQLYDQGDETVVAAWVHNPYWQYFSGFDTFQWQLPCEPSDLVHFRKRIGKAGMQRIFEVSVKLHGEAATTEKEVVVDTTVQEKNITYPTDTNLYRKIAQQCVKIAGNEGISLRRSYRRTIPKLVFAQRGRNRPGTHKKAIKATGKLKTIAGRLVRELHRKLPVEVLERYQERLSVFQQVLDQKRLDKDKIYSLHERHVYCMSKGKAHKRYEYGSKVSIAMTASSGIIVSAINLEKNQYDGKTLPGVLNDIEDVTGCRPRVAIVDRGYRGRKQIETTEIISADKLRSKLTPYQKRKTRRRLRRRAAIEPIIGHLKADFRLARNYLKGVIGDHMNVLLAAAAFNIRKWLRMAAFFVSFLLRTQNLDNEPYKIAA